IWILLISLIEGLLTGIASSYYSSQRNYDEKDELSNHKFREEIIDDPTEYLMEFEDDEEDY
ncbi:MAG: hypothetical protein OEY49_15285, partial [Candidatus Heimdallarchaeota archaeon]|nr:hypothetical protein [Candidatus Heimdallarchaeota archaeon]